MIIPISPQAYGHRESPKCPRPPALSHQSHLCFLLTSVVIASTVPDRGMKINMDLAPTIEAVQQSFYRGRQFSFCSTSFDHDS
ncbi:hypothetical protein BDZ45DRAFT_673962 [Acephala macrosclerotiorum]|nr:hypothetical protein BDZ45DRAFT_673962 [Acephala macrosclerotiorum]